MASGKLCAQSLIKRGTVKEGRDDMEREKPKYIPNTLYQICGCMGPALWYENNIPSLLRAFKCFHRTYGVQRLCTYILGRDQLVNTKENGWGGNAPFPFIPKIDTAFVSKITSLFLGILLESKCGLVFCYKLLFIIVMGGDGAMVVS